MKALLALLMFVMVSTAHAVSTSHGNATRIGKALPEVGYIAAFMVLIGQDTTEACDFGPTHNVKAPNGNYYFNVSDCDYQAKYK